MSWADVDFGCISSWPFVRLEILASASILHYSAIYGIEVMLQFHYKNEKLTTIKLHALLAMPLITAGY